jgi:DNA-binding Xre family transcriptional regulator
MKASNSLRRWVKSQMKDRGWNQLDLSNATGMNPSTWSRFFSGAYEHLRGETVDALCQIFEVPEADLYRISVNKKPMSPDVVELAEWLERQDSSTRKKIYRSAERQGWQSKCNQAGITQ